MDRLADTALASLTDRLSALLASESGAEILTLLQKVTVLAAKQADAAEAAESLRVGIWDPQPREDGTVEFARTPELVEEWKFWAEVDRIPPKRGPRVVLLGESAARGYLYDPAITFAGVLEETLAAVPGLCDVEVVDLARSDLTPGQLEPLAGTLPALEPDAVVLFAGNNWHHVVFGLDGFHKLAAAIREDGYLGCRRVFISELVVPRAETTMDALVRGTSEFDIPVLVVVPEFNLLDWKSESSGLAPVLKDEANVGWMNARDAAERALLEGRLEDAAALAQEMIELDRGTSAVSQELLGKVELRRGRTNEARASFEAARDAVYGLLAPHAPRCPSEVQEVLRRKSAEHGFALVDLPLIFEQHLDGGLPGRDLFLDYCHLTVEGMRVAAAHATEQLAPILTGKRWSGRPHRFLAAPADEALGHFLAAIHNAHYGQPEEIVRHHCARAVEASESICEHMLNFLDYQCRSAEPWMCASLDESAESPIFRRYLNATGSRMMSRLADYRLMEAMVSVLEASGIEARGLMDSLIRAELGDSESVDLLAERFSAETFRQRDGHSIGPRRAYYRAFDTRSSFYLVRTRTGPVRLQLTCRLPGEDGNRADVEVSMNGLSVGRVSAQNAWETFEFFTPEAGARDGVNLVELTWPLRPPRWRDELERSARGIERGEFPDVLPAYGEIHSFTASAA